jgi:hypothetical protein
VLAGFKGQRNSSAIFFNEFGVNLGFQIAGEPRPGFALVGCQLRLQQLVDGDRSDNQDDSHLDQNAQPTDWTANLDAVSQPAATELPLASRETGLRWSPRTQFGWD